MIGVTLDNLYKSKLTFVPFPKLMMHDHNKQIVLFSKIGCGVVIDCDIHYADTIGKYYTGIDMNWYRDYNEAITIKNSKIHE